MIAPTSPVWLQRPNQVELAFWLKSPRNVYWLFTWEFGKESNKLFVPRGAVVCGQGLEGQELGSKGIDARGDASRNWSRWESYWPHRIRWQTSGRW